VLQKKVMLILVEQINANRFE